MNLYISRRVSGFTAALMILPLFSFGAAAQLAVSANDGKAVLVNGVNTVPPNPADDTVTIIDLGVSPPKVLGELKAPSSVVGPPQNVAIAPDESIALVSSNMKLDPADPKVNAITSIVSKYFAERTAEVLARVNEVLGQISPDELH